MDRKTQIGLEPKDTKTLANLLNNLLANYQVFYLNARGFHWNIRGDKFFELHAKFEELYTDSLVKIDEIAERILTLGYTPLHSFNDYLRVSEVPEQTGVSDGNSAVSHILEGFKILLVKERELLKLSAEVEDEGTNALMSDYIREQEKAVWMYSAFLARK
jgi:starvation-inducible DNA-binding protein